MKTFTLWRGDTLLGRFTEHMPVRRRGEPVGSYGILKPTDAFAGTTGMMQTRFRLPSDTFVYQSPIEPMSATAAPVTGRREAGSKRVTVEAEITESEYRPIPADLLFTIRNEAGDAVEAEMISLELMVIPPEIDPRLVYEANGLAGDSREMWQVSFFHIPSEADAQIKR